MALQQSVELREAFLHFFQAIEQGDGAMAANLLSREEGVLGIGTDPGEWLERQATLVRMLTAQAQEMRAAGIRLQASNPRCYQDGDVGWCADQVQIGVPDSASAQARVTAVFHREGETWKVVQFHASIGVSNADVLGTDLTTG